MGDGAMGLGAVNPTRVAITAWDWGSYLGDKGIKEGIRAKVSSLHPHAREREHGAREDLRAVRQLILAKREAVLAGYDEAILLDIRGFVAEASGENIFWWAGSGTVRTPSLSSPILRGITRDTVIKLLRDSGREVQEVTFTRDALYIADEVFFTGTAAEVTPVREVDNRQVGDGQARRDHPGDAGACTSASCAGTSRSTRSGSPTSERRRPPLPPRGGGPGHRQAGDPDEQAAREPRSPPITEERPPGRVGSDISEEKTGNFGPTPGHGDNPFNLENPAILDIAPPEPKIAGGDGPQDRPAVGHRAQVPLLRGHRHRRARWPRRCACPGPA